MPAMLPALTPVRGELELLLLPAGLALLGSEVVGEWCSSDKRLDLFPPAGPVLFASE